MTFRWAARYSGLARDPLSNAVDMGRRVQGDFVILKIVKDKFDNGVVVESGSSHRVSLFVHEAEC
jgi:hypothetical protein